MDVSIGTCLPDVGAALADLRQCDVVGRIWCKDHTVWESEPTEIINNRLGWLTVTDLMRKQIPSLEHFAREIRGAGFRHVVLLSMGGSSLGPEVLRQTFGSAKGYPELIVLHSTGQLHKGGPETGLFLQVTAGHEKDLPIPGKPYTFGVLADAQALGDVQALQSLGRHVTGIHFSKVNGAAISRLANEELAGQRTNKRRLR